MTNRSFSLPLFVAILTGFACVSQASVDQRASAFVLCKSQKNVRTIRITPSSQDEGCKITYSKSGVDETVGESRSNANCQTVLKNIQANLESSKWNCRRVGNANITWGAEVVR